MGRRYDHIPLSRQQIGAAAQIDAVFEEEDSEEAFRRIGDFILVAPYTFCFINNAVIPLSLSVCLFLFCTRTYNLSPIFICLFIHFPYVSDHCVPVNNLALMHSTHIEK